ncbi:acyltransferase family protein [Aeoliella mucimassa]|nr:acyltransferase [Aeoliella mucimassa]
MMRNTGLDIMRFVAVALVLGRHLHLPDQPNVVLATWYRGGWVGVDLFFVLSGYLIATLLFKAYERTGTIDVRKFLIQRGLKIFPAFWCFLLVMLCVQVWYIHRPLSLWPILGELLMMQNHVGRVWNHTWSLAVEIHFYLFLSLLFALACYLQPKQRFGFVPYVCGALAVLCLAARYYTVYASDLDVLSIPLMGTHCRIDSLFFGVLVAYLITWKQLDVRLKSLHTEWLVIAGSMLLLPAFISPQDSYRWVIVFGVIPFYLGSGLLLLASLRLETTDSKLLSGIATLGAASYSIYLWHMPINLWAMYVVPDLHQVHYWQVYASLYLVGSLVIGWCLNRWIEMPVLALRNKVAPRTVTVVPTPGVA